MTASGWVARRGRWLKLQDSLRREGFRLVATITDCDLAANTGVTAPENEVITFFTKQEANAGKETQNVVIR